MKQNEPLVNIGKDWGVFSVSPDVNSKAYHDAFDSMPLPKPVRESVYVQAGRILSATDGTENEHMAAINSRTGELLADNLSRKPAAKKTGFNADEIATIDAAGESVVIVHNHPASYQPSYRDILTAARDERIAASVVLGHDGSVWYMAIDDAQIANYLAKYYNQYADAYGEYVEMKAVNELLAFNEKHRLFEWRRLR